MVQILLHNFALEQVEVVRAEDYLLPSLNRPLMIVKQHLVCFLSMANITSHGMQRAPSKVVRPVRGPLQLH